jgi:hypothetical protein
VDESGTTTGGRCAISRVRRWSRRYHRSCSRPTPGACPVGDSVAIAQYFGGDDGFDRAITDYSECHADKNDQDFKEFVKAVRTGRIVALQGV